MHTTRQDVIAGDARLQTLLLEYPGASQTIVMLHEGLGSIDLWKGFPLQVANSSRCNVLLYSRKGYGRSEPFTQLTRPVNYLHYEAETVLPEVLDVFQLSQPILFGHSDGASIALIFAGRYPRRCGGVFSEAAHVFVEDLTLHGITSMSDTYNDVIEAKLSRYHDAPAAVFWSWSKTWLNPEFKSWNIEASLGNISCPVLAIQGDQDEYGTSAQLEAIQKHCTSHKTETHMLVNCGHSPHRDQPELVLSMLQQFLSW
jgi:pimeloyl-ACP methyl ester carboxylesterase